MNSAVKSVVFMQSVSRVRVFLSRKFINLTSARTERVTQIKNSSFKIPLYIKGGEDNKY